MSLRLANRFGWIVGLAISLLGLLTGCPAPAVGDPCQPESVPCDTSSGQCGFNSAEAYIEAGSVQCRTRVCMVYHLDGDPREGCEPADCASQDDVEKSVYCTCRCDAPDSDASTCECPDGFECTEILGLGGTGIQGSYCVKPKPGEATE